MVVHNRSFIQGYGIGTLSTAKHRLFNSSVNSCLQIIFHFAVDHGYAMLWRDRLASIVPRGTWAYGTNLCDGIFNLETVLLRQADVIDYGEEQCHHLTVCVVGPPEAGKTSLIRKLSGTL